MLDSKGFKRPTYSEIYTEMEQEAKNRYGDDVNTSERSFLGIILRIFAWFLSKVWQDSENTYNSAYVNTAEGVQLDRLGPYVGIQRNLATWANGQIEITGTPNYTVPAGFLVSTESEIVFQTLEPITLNSSGLGNGDIQALEPGTTGNVGANTITVINNPIVDVTSASNPERTAGGQDKETDPEFRERFAQSIAGGGAATIDALRSALLSTPNVRAASIVENDSIEVVEGRPPKSFEAYCLGGDAQDIAKTILSTKAAGIETYGSESVQVPDLSGQMHTIKFSFAEEVNVHIRATVTRDNRYPVDGNQSIKTALIRYIGGEDASGQIYAGLNMGESVVHARLIAAAFGIEGVTDVKIEVSTDGVSWSESNISIGIHQVAQTAYTIIEVQS